MIDYNKYAVPHCEKISGKRAVQKTTHSRAKFSKLTAENKKFLKLIGLLK